LLDFGKISGQLHIDRALIKRSLRFHYVIAVLLFVESYYRYAESCHIEAECSAGDDVDDMPIIIQHSFVSNILFIKHSIPGECSAVYLARFIEICSAPHFFSRWLLGNGTEGNISFITTTIRFAKFQDPSSTLQHTSTFLGLSHKALIRTTSHVLVTRL
jgi:hypothetical protein